jgi:hypothetical protein
MTATRIRKKGCPFCKAKPDRCFPWFMAVGHNASIVCFDCGASGPGVRLELNDPRHKDDIMEKIWSKWNGRG